MKSELEQERLQSAKLCRENETLRALNIECSRLASERSAKLTEMEFVLEWASEYLREVKHWPNNSWSAYGNVYGISSNAPTLYDALYSAWKERGEK